MEAIYTRQSADKKDSISVETQVEFCKRELSSDNYKVYQDKGFSGGNINRPDFQQLMADIKNGLITKVIVYRLDRISRSILNFTSMMEIFNKYKVEFVSCNEKLDTTTPAGRMVVNILIVFAQYERESAQQRIKDNYYERAKRGVFLGGNTPFGYDFKNVKIANKRTSMLVVEQETALIVKKIFDMYVNGMSLGEIAKYFNANNIAVGKANNGCRSNTITRILRNPAYVKADMNVYQFLDMKNCTIVNELEDFNGNNGLISYGEGDTKFSDISGYNIAVGLHDGFIDSDIWLKAQYRVYDNKQIANSGNSQNTWLSGITKCGYCGYAMTYKGYSKKVKGVKRDYKYLRCSGKTYKACSSDMPYLYLEDVENDVFELLIKFIKDKNIRISNDTDNEKINDAKLDLSIVDKKIDKLVESLMEANDVTMTYINKAITKLDAQKKEITNKIIGLENTKSSTANISIQDYIDSWDELSIEKKKEFVRSYVNEIRIFKDNNIEIDFK